MPRLASNPGKLCERGELLEKVWDLPPTLNTRTVDTHVKRLREMSPLWEMVQDGVDLSQVKWTHH
jgi:DNA-binding response OmpR family regulator